MAKSPQPNLIMRGDWSGIEPMELSQSQAKINKPNLIMRKEWSGIEPMELVQTDSKLKGDPGRDSSGLEHIQGILTDLKPEEGEPRFDWDGVEPMEGAQGDEPMEAASGEG